MWTNKKQSHVLLLFPFFPSWNDGPKLSDHENIWDESRLLLRAWTQQAHWVPMYAVAFAISQSVSQLITSARVPQIT